MSLRKDLRFAFRQHRKTPGFTLVVLVTLGLCIGVNGAIFSVLDSVLFRAAPYPEADRLAMVVTALRQHGSEESINWAQTGSLFEAVRDGAPGLDSAAYSGDKPANLNAGDRPESIRQQRVSAGYFRVLGVPPQFGREFTRREDIPGGPAVAVISYRFWQRIFHGSVSAIGASIRLQGIPYTVIGVMPQDFRSTVPADIWTPLRPTRTGEGGGSNYDVVARLRPDVSWPEAGGQLKALSRGLMVMPGFPRDYPEFEERIVPFQQGLTQRVRTQLYVTWAAVLVVLAIGCVNIAGLLLSRSGIRQREIATRMALGANRASIVRQLLVESLLLAIGGCVVGIGVGSFALAGLKYVGAANFEASFEMWRPIELDARVILAMFGMAFLTSILFGLAPALQTSRVDIRSVLVEGGRAIAGGGSRWSRNVLVVGEVALSLTLLISAGLFVKTLTYLYGLNPGFDPHNVITAEASLATEAGEQGRYATRAGVENLYTASLERIRAIKGVRSAAAALTLPYERPLNYGFRIPEVGDPNGHATEMVYLTPGYFETLRIPVYAGRSFRDTDSAEGPRVAVVSQSFVTKFLRGRPPLGAHITIDRIPREIVGVVGDVQQHSGLQDLGPLAVEPTVYVPVSQTSDGFLRLIHTWIAPKWVIRIDGATGHIERDVRNAVAAVDPGLAISKFQTIGDLEGRYTTDQRYLAALFGALAGLALLLAAIGLYGLIAQSVTRRSHELGLRLALGATAQQTMTDVVKPGLTLAGIGIVAGFILSRLAVRFLDSLLFGVRSTDVATFVVTALLLLVVAGIASAAPALRILSLDPARTLRND